MGKFILLAAQAKAAAEDIPAKGIIRQGNVSQEIVDLCHELEADYLVLGRRQVQDEESILTHDLLQCLFYQEGFPGLDSYGRPGHGLAADTFSGVGRLTLLHSGASDEIAQSRSLQYTAWQ